MAQLVKKLATKPDDVNSTPGTSQCRRDSNPTSCAPNSTYALWQRKVHTHTHAHTHTHSHTQKHRHSPHYHSQHHQVNNIREKRRKQ